MSQPSVTHPTCIGIDLGDSHSHLFVLDLASGEVLEEGRIPCTPAAFRRRFAGQPPHGSRSRWAATRPGSAASWRRRATKSWSPTLVSCG